MKPFLLLSLAGLLVTSAAQAQIGVKAGVNAAMLNGEQISQDTKLTYSYHAGVFYTYNLAGPLSVRPELQFSAQGSSFKSAKEDFQTHLNYLELPIMANLRLGRLHVQAGPQFGVLLSAQQEGKTFTGYNATTGAEEFQNVSNQVTDQFKRQDFSLCAGLEYNILLGLRVGGRFVAGMNDIANYKDVRSVNDPRLKNRVFQVYAAFQLGKE